MSLEVAKGHRTHLERLLKRVRGGPDSQVNAVLPTGKKQKIVELAAVLRSRSWEKNENKLPGKGKRRREFLNTLKWWHEYSGPGSLEKGIIFLIHKLSPLFKFE